MYKDIKAIYDKTNTIMFVMAVTHLLDIGIRSAVEITNEDIENLAGNGLMTEDFVRDLVRTTRDIAKICEHDTTEIIQFCMVEKIFDTKWYKKGA